MSLLERVVVPPRLSLIVRGDQTLGYNPAINRWDPLEKDAAEVLRWLRSGRDRSALLEHLARRPGPEAGTPQDRVEAILKSLVLRRLLYLDAAPDIAPPTAPENPLAVVYWICTQACNLRCTYCYQSAATRHPNELSTTEAYDLVDQVVESGAKTLIFTGGEAFTRPDLVPIARYAREVGLQANVITNGDYITPENIDEVAAVFNNVTVSLDHGRPEHHDCNRGQGSWARAVAAIDLLVRAGVPVDVNTVLSHYGLRDIEELLSFIQSRPLGDHRIVPQFPMGRGGGARARRGELSEAELLGLNDRLVEARARAVTATGRTSVSPEGSYGRKMSRRNHCGAGLSEVSVDPQGWVYPCKLLQYKEFRTENVRDRRLGDIYAADPSLSGIRRSTTEALQPCRTCIIKNHCGGGCRGIHFSFTHDYVRAHPLFCAYLRRTFEAQAWAGAGRQPAPRRRDFHGAHDEEYAAAVESPCSSGGTGEAFVPLTAVGRAGSRVATRGDGVR